MGSDQSRPENGENRSNRKRFSLPIFHNISHRPDSTVKRPTNSACRDSAPELLAALEFQSQRINCSSAHNDKFTEFEQDILLSTWPLIASNLADNGCMVFKNAFSLYPRLRLFFPFGDTDPEELIQDERARSHATKYMLVIQKAVDELEHETGTFVDELILLGAKHAAIPGMKIEYFKILKQATLLTWDKLMYEEFTDDVRKAWAHLLDYIIGILNEGCLVFEEEEEKILLETEHSPQLQTGDQIDPSEPSLRRSGRPSVINMSPEELAHVYSSCK